jgi:hypothetical protein
MTDRRPQTTVRAATIATCTLEPMSISPSLATDLRAPTSLGLLSYHDAAVERPGVEEVRFHVHPELAIRELSTRQLDALLRDHGFGDIRVRPTSRRLVLTTLEFDACTVSTDAPRRLRAAARLLIDELTRRRPPADDQQLTLPFLPALPQPPAARPAALRRAA